MEKYEELEKLCKEFDCSKRYNQQLELHTKIQNILPIPIKTIKAIQENGIQCIFCSKCGKLNLSSRHVINKNGLCKECSYKKQSEDRTITYKPHTEQNYNYNTFMKDLKVISKKWDFLHRWNWNNNLLLFQDFSKKYPFFTSHILRAYKDGKSLQCPVCKGITCNPNKCCSHKCSSQYDVRKEKIRNTKLNYTKEEKQKINEKRENTCLKKYGVTNVRKSNKVMKEARKIVAEKLRNRIITQEELEHKNEARYKTCKKNNSFKVSYQENFSLFLVHKLYSDSIAQYKSDKYPFFCDCYIPSKKLYIEFNYSWTHGGHPYDKVKDRKALSRLKQSKSLYIKNMIETWTIRDVKKVQTAKKNKIKLKVFYTSEEFCKWLLKQNIFDSRYSSNLSRKEKLFALKRMFITVGRARNSEVPTFKKDIIFKTYKDILINSKVEGCLSLQEGWNDEQCRYKAIYNMLKYVPEQLIQDTYMDKFAKRFTISKIAPMVTTFQPKFAKELIQEYFPDCKTVIDPFSGFGGRMIGVCSLGKKYIGFDINKKIVECSNNLLKVMNLNATVRYEDICKGKKHKADCLLTCPPYNLKETWDEKIQDKSCDEWIDICLKNYQCNTYIFVVDKTEKYKKFVVKSITNGKKGKHINNGSQQIIVMTREEAVQRIKNGEV